jgi:hypothetical protein
MDLWLREKIPIGRQVGNAKLAGLAMAKSVAKNMKGTNKQCISLFV